MLHKNFVQTANFDELPCYQNIIFEKIFKNFLARSHKGDEAETFK